jgi:Flp pilus assembly protein TadG
MKVRRERVARSRRRGSALVEMAVLLPLFITIIAVQIESARMAMVTQVLTTAAREGCRRAVLHNFDLSDVNAQVDNVISGAGIPSNSITRTVTCPDDPSLNWQTAPGGTAIRVTLVLDYSRVSWFPIPSYFSLPTSITSQATLTSERF